MCPTEYKKLKQYNAIHSKINFILHHQRNEEQKLHPDCCTNCSRYPVTEHSWQCTAAMWSLAHGWEMLLLSWCSSRLGCQPINCHGGAEQCGSAAAAKNMTLANCASPQHRISSAAAHTTCLDERRRTWGSSTPGRLQAQLRMAYTKDEEICSHQ